MLDMSYSSDGMKLTEQFEGLRLNAYKDLGGVLTIGYGHTRGVFAGMEITNEMAEAFLRADIRAAEIVVNKFVTVEITQAQFDALVDFQFNTGALGKSTMLKLLNAGNYAGAACEFEEWDHVSGKVVAGLLRRRIAEKLIFQKGDK